MAVQPPPPPEAQIIGERRRAMIPELSMRQAAKRAGFSPALWAKIEHGYDQVATGVVIPYKGTAEKVARMARVTGVTADELDKLGRADAARVLRNIRPSREEIRERFLRADEAARRARAELLEMGEDPHAQDDDDDVPRRHQA